MTIRPRRDHEVNLDPQRGGGIWVDAVENSDGTLQINYRGGKKWTVAPDGTFKDENGKAPELTKKLAEDALKVIDKIEKDEHGLTSDMKHLRDRLRQKAGITNGRGTVKSKELGGHVPLDIEKAVHPDLRAALQMTGEELSPALGGKTKATSRNV